MMQFRGIQNRCVLLLLVLIFQFGFGQDSAGQYSIEDLFHDQIADRDPTQLISITFPSDSDTFAIDRIRFGAWTPDTTARVTVNGIAEKVYPSGAVTSLLHLEPGWNHIPFTVELNTSAQEVILHLYRIPPLEPLMEMPTEILDTFMLPSSDLSYFSSDKIVVRFFGSPGGEATFRIKGLFRKSLPMAELPPERANGKLGVYEGVYVIKPSDRIHARKVTFQLKGIDGRKIKRKSQGRVTVHKQEQPKLLVTSDNYSLIRVSRGGEIFMDLPAGIVLEAVSRQDAWWKVMVSKNRTGWITSGSIKESAPGMDIPQAALTSISTEVDTNWITLNFNLSEKVPFDITQHANPNRISVTFFRTHFQDEWSVYPDSIPWLDHYDWSQVEEDVLRFDVVLDLPQLWGFQGKYEGTKFKLGIRRPPTLEAHNPFKHLVIALDAGHGGDHRGAMGATGLMEKDVNLVYAYYLARLLEEKGAQVILTRPEDRTMSLKERMDIAREADAHLFLWLHNNSTGMIRHPLDVQGTSTYYAHLQGWPFARRIYPHLLKLGLAPAGQLHRSYYMTRQTDMPVVLVEGAFLSNPEDELFLMQDENLKKLSQAVFDGLEEYLLELAGEGEREE